MKPFEVVVTNLLTQKIKAGPVGFENKQEAQKWTDDQLKDSKPWGLQKERWVSRKVQGSIGERQLEFDGTNHKQYLLPAEFEVEIKDNRDELRRLEVKQKWEKLRKDRNQKLKDTDWIMLGDCPLDRKTKMEYVEYRRYLRDIPTLYQNKQIIKLIVMSFEMWQKNKPIYKPE